MSSTATTGRAGTDDPINIVNYLTGATVKPGPMVTAPPTAIMTDDLLKDFAPGSGLNGPFVADLLAAALAHERDGVNLFRMLAAISQNPALIAKFGQLAEESMQASKQWSQLITTLGGSDQYASPPGRLTETMDNKIVESFLGTGSADPLSIEMAAVQAALLASTLCVAFVDLLIALSEEADDESSQSMQQAAQPLQATAAEHVAWANQQLHTMAITLAKHHLAQTIGQAAEKMVGKVKDALH
jgi:hypothetical protein